MYPEMINPKEDPVSDNPGCESETCSSPDRHEEEEAAGLEEFSVFLEKLSPLVDEMKDKKEMIDSEETHKAINSMEAEYYRAKTAMSNPNFRSTSPNHIQDMTHNLGRSLGLVLFASSSYEVPFDNKDKIDALHKAMMNAKKVEPLHTSDDDDDELISEAIIISSSSSSEHQPEQEQEQEQEENQIVLDKRDVVFRLSCGNHEEFTFAICDLKLMIRDNKINDDTIDKESIISVLSTRFKGAKSDDRVAIIQLLRSLINISDKSKERMSDLGFLSVLVKSLARDVEERREAVGLLSRLSNIPDVRRRIGRIQGCIVMLVSILESGDEVAMLDAAKLLDSLSANPQCALNMAEAGYFDPLIHYLKHGSDLHKMLMTTALSRIELTDKSKASLGEDGAIELLVNMFICGNFEAKLSALNSLRKISTLKENIQRLIDCDFVAPLLQLLFSVTSVLMSLREPASAILALIAQSESILAKQDVAQQMLSLLSLTSPSIQYHLLNALNSIANHANARKVTRKMRGKGAIQLLLPFITNRNISPKIMLAALELVYKLSKGEQDDLMQKLGEPNVNIIANIVTSSTASMNVRAAAIGVLSNLPPTDKKSTDILKKANLLPVLVSLLSMTSSSASFASSAELAESISGILIRFTIPSDKNLQRYSVDQGLFPALVKLLCNGSALAKSRAASCLAHLSQNSLSLTVSKSRRSRWLCLAHAGDPICEVHDQYCSINSTFCLVKANVVPCLIKILETDESDAHEEVLGCIATLLDGETVTNGSKFIAKHSGINPIIRVLDSEGSVKAKEKAIWILERIFSLEIHRVEYGESAQMILLELAKHGDAKLKPILARVLAQLELLQVQSTYF